MKLAVNYSPQAADLLQKGQIQFDLFKTPNWHDMVAEASAQLPVYVHFDLTVGDGRLSEVDWPEVEDFLSKTGTEIVNLHVVAPPDLDPCDHIQVDELQDSIIDEVQTVCKRFGPDRVITENVPLPENGKRYLWSVALPPFFQKLVAETGCGMLLDLAHAAITAKTLKTDPGAFFSEFPVRRLKEIHITGLGLHEGEIQDHMEMKDRDWCLFEIAIHNIRMGNWRAPEIIAFEYGGTGAPFVWRSESRVLLEQVPRLNSLVHNGNGKDTSR
ncbi:MAG TPA: DUF692 family protein [Leptolinea sp.]